MSLPRLFKISLLIAVALNCCIAHAQTPDEPIEKRERAMQLYAQGKDKEAVKALQAFLKRYKMDSRAWHYLGLALNRQGKTDEARNAHEKAALYAGALALEYLAGAEPYALRLMVGPLEKQLAEAAESADKYLELSEQPSAAKVTEWRALAQYLRSYLEVPPPPGKKKEAEEVQPDAKGVTKKARIHSRPSPSYTMEARSHDTEGSVVLSMVLSGDGTVKGIVPIISLPYGLTQQAVKAARQIKFTPAIKNDKPVSQWIRIEYSFNIN